MKKYFHFSKAQDKIPAESLLSSTPAKISQFEEYKTNCHSKYNRWKFSTVDLADLFSFPRIGLQSDSFSHHWEIFKHKSM